MTINGEEFNAEQFKLLAEQLSIPDLDMGVKYYSPAERGHYLEPVAVKDFNEQYKTNYKQVDNELIEKNNYNDYIGVSPDAYIKDKQAQITNALEIKCLGAENHLHAYYTLFMDEKNGNTSAPQQQVKELEFYPQLLQYFIVIPTLENIILYFYNPLFKSEKLKRFFVKLTLSDVFNDMSELLTLEKETVKKIKEVKNLL
ncbi:MAG: YqaJ viral recombinase family protein [Endomicrobium sp.]|jgi:hypothetical protein|nr:YqaJ viral recombinase family protein [Endomicrobium sp.]